MINVLKEIYEDERYWVPNKDDTGERYNVWHEKLGLSPFFMLGGNDFSIILPRHWETVVRPGDSVALRFEDPQLNEVPDPRGRRSEKTRKKKDGLGIERGGFWNKMRKRWMEGGFE
jgi:hypothetical protein